MTGGLGTAARPAVPRAPSVPRGRDDADAAKDAGSDDSDEFHSAQSSPERSEGDVDEDGARRYSAELDSPQRRTAFAERLRDALRREALSSSHSEDSSYAVGITVAGTGLSDEDIRYLVLTYCR